MLPIHCRLKELNSDLIYTRCMNPFIFCIRVLEAKAIMKPVCGGFYQGKTTSNSCDKKEEPAILHEIW